MDEPETTVRVAGVQAAPVFLDRERTVAKACRLIREAGDRGARVIGFPEGFIPTHPVWNHFVAGRHPDAMRFAKELFENAVEIPSDATDALGAAAADADAYVVMGVCERLPGTTGTLYNTQLVLGPDGSIVGSRRKIVPTGGERLVHAGGSGRSIRVFETEFGPMSGFLCAENANPLAVFSVAAMHTRLHVASWPQHFHPLGSMPETIPVASRALAFQTKCFVINAAGVPGEDEIEAVAQSEEDRAYLEDVRENDGGSSIVGPDGRVLAGPLGPGEDIVYADIDLDRCVVGKYVHDYAGHYNRPDIFTVTVNRGEPQLLELGTELPEWPDDLRFD